MLQLPHSQLIHGTEARGASYFTLDSAKVPLFSSKGWHPLPLEVLPIEILQYQRARLFAANNRVIEVSMDCGDVMSSVARLSDGMAFSNGVFMT